MSGQQELERARAELDDASLPAGRLAEIAGAHPELRHRIASHPSLYPDLRDWLIEQTGSAPGNHGASRGVASEQPASAASLPRFAHTKVLLAGVGIGLVIGAALSAVTLLWVLPGLFGSVLG